jgi:hypothetical protein
MKFLLCLALFGLVVSALGGKTRYDGYKVYRVTPQTEEHVSILAELEKSNLGVREGSMWHPFLHIGNR